MGGNCTYAAWHFSWCWVAEEYKNHSQVRASMDVPGRFYSACSTGKSECHGCQPGRWSLAHQPSCAPCDASSYSNQHAAKNCTACPISSKVLNVPGKKISDCICQPAVRLYQRFKRDSSSFECASCPSGGQCEGTDVTSAQACMRNDDHSQMKIMTMMTMLTMCAGGLLEASHRAPRVPTVPKPSGVRSRPQHIAALHAPLRGRSVCGVREGVRAESGHACL